MVEAVEARAAARDHDICRIKRSGPGGFNGVVPHASAGGSRAAAWEVGRRVARAWSISAESKCQAPSLDSADMAAAERVAPVAALGTWLLRNRSGRAPLI